MEVNLLSSNQRENLVFKKQFLANADCKSLFNTDKVILVALVGSRGLDLADSQSDYDLLVLVKNDTDEEIFRSYFANYNNLKVHWHVYGWSHYIAQLWRYPSFSVQGHLLAPIQFGLIALENLLFLNKKYEKQITYLIENRKPFLLIAMGRYFKYVQNYIEEVVYRPDFEYKKRCYHLAYMAVYLSGQKIQAKKDFLCRLKRVTYEKLPEEDRQMLKMLCEFLLRYIENTDYTEKHKVFCEIQKTSMLLMENE